jgi:hypothetical protein
MAKYDRRTTSGATRLVHEPYRFQFLRTSTLVTMARKIAHLLSKEVSDARHPRAHPGPAPQAEVRVLNLRLRQSPTIRAAKTTETTKTTFR